MNLEEKWNPQVNIIEKDGGKRLLLLMWTDKQAVYSLIKGM